MRVFVCVDGGIVFVFVFVVVVVVVGGVVVALDSGGGQIRWSVRMLRCCLVGEVTMVE
jgi:hypothetical protein